MLSSAAIMLLFASMAVIVVCILAAAASAYYVSERDPYAATAWFAIMCGAGAVFMCLAHVHEKLVPIVDQH